MELFVLGVNLLLLALFWKCVWARTLLDKTRDQLFDLRDGARDWFVKQGIQLDDGVYLALRKVLNSHLRHTESITFTRYFATVLVFEKNKLVASDVKKELSALFASEDKAIKAYIDDVRGKAAAVLFLHMVRRSLFLSMLFLVLGLFFCVYDFVKFIIHSLLSKSLTCCRSGKFAMATAVVMSLVSVVPYGKYFNQVHLEEYSMRSSDSSGLRTARYCW